MKQTFRSAEKLRERVAKWCEEHGGVRKTDDEYNSILGGVIGGDYELDTPIGKWIVHLPCDERDDFGFSINTRFEDWPEGKLPADANPYSGKWNWSCHTDENELFTSFTRSAGRYVTPSGDALPEYDLTGGERGKYAERYKAGVTVNVIKPKDSK